MEKIGSYQRGLGVVSEDIRVVALRRGNALALFDVFQGAEQIAIGSGLFEEFFFGGGGHAGFEALHQVVALAFEKKAGIAKGFGVALVGGEAFDARAEAALDVVLQARPRVIAGEVDIAGRHEKSLVDEVQDAARQAWGKIGPEIERAVFFDFAREIDAGIFFGGGQLDVGIGLIVAQEDVEFGLILLDEIVFKRQGFARIGEDDGVEVGDFADERTGFGVDPARFQEVGTHAAAERGGFADVEDRVRGVFE